MPIIVRSIERQSCSLLETMEQAKNLVRVNSGLAFIDFGEGEDDPHCCGFCDVCSNKICEEENDD